MTRLAGSLLALLLLALPATAQVNEIPNPGFEAWTDFAPVDYGAFQPPQRFYQTVFRSTEAAQGELAVELRTVDFQGVPFNGGVFACLVGDCREGPPSEGALFFPVTVRYTNVCGFYQGAPVGGDKLFIDVVLRRGGSVIGGTDAGSGSAFIRQGRTQWTPFNVPIRYLPGVPDDAKPEAASLQVASFGPDFPGGNPMEYNGHPGTRWLIDGLYFCNADGEAVGPPGGADAGALLIIGDAAAPTPSDDQVAALLSALGFSVIVRSDEAALPAEAGSLVVVAATAEAALVAPGFAAVEVPLVAWGAPLFARLGLTGAAPGLDHGWTLPRVALTVADAAHPIAGGLSGEVPVYTAAAPLAFGRPSSGASTIATAEGRAVLFAYEAGTTGPGGATPARRAALFMDAEGPARATDAGRALLRNTLLWAAGREGEIPAGVRREAPATLPAPRLEAYPNPFRTATTLHLVLPRSGPVRLTVYDALGRELTRLVDAVLPAGSQHIGFDAGALPPGAYVVRLEGPAGVRTSRLLFHTR